MKGALAIMLELFRRLHEHRPGLSLEMAVTADEETGGEHGIGHLVERCGLCCAMAMIPDGGWLNDITVDEKEVTTEVTDRPVPLVRDSGGSDARFLTRHGVGVLMSRPLVGNLNAPDEWIDIESMLVFHRICDVYLRRRFELLPEPDGA